MKKKVFVAMLALALVFGVVLTGCESTNFISKENYGTFPTLTSIPAKDFIGLGLVFTENVIENSQGEIFTYRALLKEAQALGADAIINVSIDVKRETTLSGARRNDKETWYGAATAIKYVEGTLSDSTTTTTGGVATSGGTVTTTERVRMNASGR
ncbi:MAG: hypothetical protein FWD36_07590 [Treponema sp.]|nr:hypothetical protein [Treponema sp.]